MRKHGKERERAETFPCHARCLNDDDSTLDLEARRILRCALPGFSEKHWLPTPQHVKRHMGALKVLPRDPPHPPEDHEDGCPGAWYRCGFVLSLHKYERLQTEHGFSENLLLSSRSDDRLLLEALTYYERERIGAKIRDLEIMHSD